MKGFIRFISVFFVFKAVWNIILGVRYTNWAEQIHQALNKNCGVDVGEIDRILSTKDESQIRAIMKQYKKLYGISFHQNYLNEMWLSKDHPILNYLIFPHKSWYTLFLVILFMLGYIASMLLIILNM